MIEKMNPRPSEGLSKDVIKMKLCRLKHTEMGLVPLIDHWSLLEESALIAKLSHSLFSNKLQTMVDYFEISTLTL